MGLTFNLGRLSPSVFTDSSLNVGIGGSPSGSYKLEVTGTAKVSSTLLVSGASTFSSAITLSTASTSYGSVFSIANTSNSKQWNFTTVGSGIAGRTGNLEINNNVADIFAITQAGNVGIGTTNPQMPLSVQANTGNGAIRLIGTSNASSNNAGIYWYDSNDSTFNGYLGNFSGSFDIYNHRSTPMVFSTAATERMRITSGGQIYNSNAPSADWGMRIFGSSVSGSSYGMEILGGTTSGDISFAVSPRNGSVYYFRVLGNGDIKSVPVYNNSTSNSANMYIFSDGSFSRSTSSIRFKTDVETLDNNISETIYKMRPIWYRSLCEKDRRDWSWYGFGAEELAKLEPRLVHWGYKKEDYVINEETKEQELKEGAELQADGVQYERITVLLVAEMQKMNNAIQELSAQNQDLKSRLDKAGL